ncbi:MAG TPA: chemotaxis protein CheW [Candidatus Acidoferrales bacterium]|nr:chemotaxis protein CheW [Candidatus Acidoferrales bacterium]
MTDETTNGANGHQIPVLDASEEIAGVAEPSREQQYCVFRSGRERFSLTVLDVEEVVDWPRVTRVPLGPPFLMGVFNLRGSIVAVVDIAFTEGRRPGLLPKHVVVTTIRGENGDEDLRLGIASDEVIGTYTLGPEALLDEVPPDVPHCCAMLRHDDRLALSIDLRKLLEVYPIPVI